MKRINHVNLRRISCIYANAQLRDVSRNNQIDLGNLEYGDKQDMLSKFSGSTAQKYRNVAKLVKILQKVKYGQSI